MGFKCRDNTTESVQQYCLVDGKLRKRKRVTCNPNRDRLDLFWAEALTPRDCRWGETLVQLSVVASWRTWTRGSRVWSAELGIVFDCLDCKDDYERLVAWGNCMYYVCMSDRQTGISISVQTSPSALLYWTGIHHGTLSQLHDVKISSGPRTALRIGLQGSCIVIITKCLPPSTVQKEAMQDRQVRNPGYPALGSCKGPVMVGNKSAGGDL